MEAEEVDVRTMLGGGAGGGGMFDNVVFLSLRSDKICNLPASRVEEIMCDLPCSRRDSNTDDDVDGRGGGIVLCGIQGTSTNRRPTTTTTKSPMVVALNTHPAPAAVVARRV